MGIQQDKMVLAGVSSEINKLVMQIALIQEAMGRNMSTFNGVTRGLDDGAPVAIRSQASTINNALNAARENMNGMATKINQYAAGLGR